MTRRGKPVAFPFYGHDWLTDPRVTLLSDAGERCFLRLLIYAHAERGVPEDPEALRRLLGREREEWPGIWAEIEQFWPVNGDGRRQNAKMARIVAEQDAFRDGSFGGGKARWAGTTPEERSEAARKAANARWSRIRLAQECEADACSPSPSPSPSPSQEPEPEEEHPPTPLGGDAVAARPPGKKTSRKRKEATGDHHEAIRHWCSEWERTRLGQPYVVDGGKDGAAVARMLKKGPLAEVKRRMTRLLESDDLWVAANASPALCASRWNQLAVQVLKGRGGRTPDYLDRLTMGLEGADAS